MIERGILLLRLRVATVFAALIVLSLPLGWGFLAFVVAGIFFGVQVVPKLRPLEFDALSVLLFESVTVCEVVSV